MNGVSIYRRLSSTYSKSRIISFANKDYSNMYRWNNINKISKRSVELPPYHPKYKKPELVYDLNLDWRKYRGLWRLIPVPPKARPAGYIFAAFIMLEYFAFVICHHLMLRTD